jgi:uncharacterized protein YwgA/O-acetyl-ADP-ribose deacetylase (regulator of RNase III)
MTERASHIDVVVGDMFASSAQTLVNTVNIVGVMGKGVALEFKKRFPDMFVDYQRRCEVGLVRIGEPYLFTPLFPPNVLNFPTKSHWRGVSKLRDIVAGLEYLERHYQDWGITSLAVPPLGCGNGGLEWRVVGPTLYAHLSRLEIPIELYAPLGTPHAQLEPGYLQSSLLDEALQPGDTPVPTRLEPGWVALVTALAELEANPHHWHVGKTTFQKLAYFATVAGIPTGLTFERSTYGPYSADLAKITSKLVNNDLLDQAQLGKMVEVKVGPTYSSADHAYAQALKTMRPAARRVADLLRRMRTRDAEIAATVHFVANELADNASNRPTEDAVLAGVMEWKQRKQPPLQQDEVLSAMQGLAMLGWLDVERSDSLPVNEPELAGF